jgi:uncharacterized membrane protein YedE/YeeE
MSLAAAAPPSRPALPGLAAGLAGCALVAATIIRLPDPALPLVFLVALALGAVFVLLDVGFAGGFRDLLEARDGRAVAATFAMPAVAALVVIPVAAMVEGYGRFVVPIGVPLVLGAAVFGVGMQIANGCGSGVLVAAGQGSRRMWVALPFFCLGGVIGSLLLPMGLMLPDLGAVDLPDLLGPGSGLLATEALLAFGALAICRFRLPEASRLRAGVAVGALAALLFLASGLPWGVTTGLTLWGARAVQALGADLSGLSFWMMDWTRAALAAPLLANHSSLADAGLLLGALLAASLRGGLRHAAPLGMRGALGAALGGLLMGIGARVSSGCNVGAFLGGAASGSLHGVIWLLAVLPGCWLGIRLRPWFGLPRR